MNEGTEQTEGGRPEAAKETRETEPEAPRAATSGSTRGPAEGAKDPGATGPDGAPRKKRRRGKRGGKRHRKKPVTEGAEQGSEGSGSSNGTSAPAAPKPKPKPRPRTPKPASPTPPADGAPVAATEPATAGEQPAGSGDGAEGQAAPARRRRRGGRGRGGGAKKPPAEGDGTQAPESKGGRKPAAKPAAAGSTRLAARAQRRQQRPRRPRHKLTEEEARQLRGTDKVMLVHEHQDRTQIAILEEGTLIEHYVARRGVRTTMAGNVYLGKVQNVLPGMEAAFIDFGRGRNGVLYAGEVNYSQEDLEGDAPTRIEHVLKNGQKLMVQVTKDPIGNKGARLTTQISLAGRYMVLAPEQRVTGISRRLAEKERGRLREFLREMRPDGHGVIVRTAAEGVPREALERDLGHLLTTWEKIQKSSKRAKAPHQLYAEPDLVQRVIRDEFSEDFTTVVVDTRDIHDEIKEYLESAAPDLLPKLQLHEGGLPLFEEWRVTEQLFKALERKVWLPSGGSIVIDRSEALTVIDVNTGKFTGKGSTLEDTVFANNLEAAEEIARQLRLRDIGGIIVIDFIDMIDPKNQKELLRTLKRALSKDKTRSQVFEVSSLGLVEMTRKKVSEGLLDAFSEPCPNCEGRGIVLTHDVD